MRKLILLIDLDSGLSPSRKELVGSTKDADAFAPTLHSGDRENHDGRESVFSAWQYRDAAVSKDRV